MNFLSVENLTKSFGERILFSDVTFGIDQGQKVAIVAKNGSGKTTLLNCLMDREQYDSGKIVFRKDIQVAFMEQSENLPLNKTIDEVIYDHESPKLRLIKDYNKAIESGDEEKLSNLFQELTELDAWDLEAKVNQLLSVFKLKDDSQLINNLSGGQKKRVALIKVLLSEADFLFLDEPTNHLDLDMIEWLESYLSTSKSTILMVTHDRYFLEVVCDTIFELADESLYKYKGNFSYYLEKKAERQEQLHSTIEKARNSFRKELDWIRRQPKARGTKQKARVDAFQDIKKTASQRLDEDELELPVKMERLGSKIVEFHKIGKAFGDLPILNSFSYNVQRKERMGIVGKNGTGKTTFLKMLLGTEPLDKGKIVVGETVVFGHFSQDLIKVNDDFKVIDVVKEVAEFIPLEKGKQLSAAQLLERFLFPRSMHYNFVRKLSGGEKRRLKLLRVLMGNPNFLILDEPTNDLDIFAMAVLEEYLRNFKGCLIVVSHDRYFMDKMVDHLLVFQGGGEVKDILGNYTDFRKNEKKVQKEKKSVSQTKKTEVKNHSTEQKKTKLSFKEKEEFNHLERDLEKLELEKSDLSAGLSDESRSNTDLYEMGKRLGEVVQQIDQKTERWMVLAEYV
ncbi:ABC-F family ATP-binding cassette domain-containing protein [Crocinitomicaceae bacterium]|jgi:ATP-binding cassette subfamily F protein uup|nr:ABC-F family ATP-binding cassette domain-containing protein [Crocinitomicaceae bacterium]MDB4340447.1 ABC-F family ATP-binding cassette domain-containing protein [Crocinitomicaceae bacterium]MDC0459969.1 ABC-F family ATP-binding cassette domain-containing protein [Crocinitomicaceae bacterium]MDC1266486.1 ABC-F family ATP-binding cassette domain-containing protein [Crocinitomicaceae bacterium]